MGVWVACTSGSVAEILPGEALPAKGASPFDYLTSCPTQVKERNQTVSIWHQQGVTQLPLLLR